MADLKEILLSKNVVIPENYSFFKDIFRHFKGKEVQGIKGDVRPLLDKAEDFYLTPSQSGGFLQGDILTNLKPVWLANDDKGDMSAFVSSPRMGMVLSNECDCERRDENSQAYIRVCPVFNESELLDENAVSKEKRASVAGNLKANYYTEYFWMPKADSKEEHLVADLSQIYSVGLEDLYAAVDSGKVKKFLSLSQDAYFLVSIKLAWFFLRPPAPDTARSGLNPFSPQ